MKMTFSENNNQHIELLAMPRSGKMNFFAAGYPEKRVAIWSVTERKKISELNTVLDFGGSRLAMVLHDKLIVATGSWDEGISAYSAEQGEVLWSRPDLIHIQQVCDLSDDKIAFIGVGMDSGAYRILRAGTGEDHTKLAGIRKIYASPHGPLYLLEDNTKHIHLSALRSPPLWKTPLSSFAVLHAAFSPTEVAISESGGFVTCFDFYGTKLWEFQPEDRHHVLHLCWDMVLQRWLAINWQYQTGGSKLLIEIDSHGVSRSLMDLGKYIETEFSPDGSYLITSNGKVISTQSTEVLWTFL